MSALPHLSRFAIFPTMRSRPSLSDSVLPVAAATAAVAMATYATFRYIYRPPTASSLPASAAVSAVDHVSPAHTDTPPSSPASPRQTVEPDVEQSRSNQPQEPSAPSVQPAPSSATASPDSLNPPIPSTSAALAPPIPPPPGFPFLLPLPPPFPFLLPPPLPPLPQQQQQQPSLQKPTSFSWTVFWDLENAAVPRNTTTSSFVSKLRTELNLLQAAPIQRILAVANVARLPRMLRATLHSAGVSLLHAETGGRKDAADKALLAELCFHSAHSSPGGVALLSGDVDFAYAIGRLSAMTFFTVIVASPAARSPLLVDAARVCIPMPYSETDASTRRVVPMRRGRMVPGTSAQTSQLAQAPTQHTQGVTSPPSTERPQFARRARARTVGTRQPVVVRTPARVTGDCVEQTVDASGLERTTRLVLPATYLLLLVLLVVVVGGKVLQAWAQREGQL